MISSCAAPLQRKPPATCQDPDVEQLAKEIDWLEALIETYGTIVPKQPDIWGEARLTRHRQEIERQMAADIDDFRETLQGSLRRSDQAFLSMAGTLSAVLGKNATGPDSTAITNILEMVELPTGAIDRSDPQELKSSKVYAALNGDEIKGLSLEPTVVLQQKYRYLQLLNELRRMNEGDDTSDAPGYSLNIVRIPVSVLPGHRTRQGYGAEITVTARSYITPELLPMTFRGLVINDIVDLFALPGRKVLDDRDLYEYLKDALESKFSSMQRRQYESPEKWLQDQVQADSDAATAIKNSGVLSFAGSLITGRSTLPLMPFPPAHMVDIFGPRDVFAAIVIDGFELLGSDPINKRYGHLSDVEAFLRAELHAAYEFLSRPEATILWQKYCTPELVAAIEQRRRYIPDRLYRARQLQIMQADQIFPSISKLRNDFFDDLQEVSPRAAYSTTASLAWAIVVDAALLNQRLLDDMQNVGGEFCDSVCWPRADSWPDFYAPQPSAEARACFAEYVRRRWPIKVFALDPVTDEQNVADAFSLRREMQMAAAVALASGNISANAAFRFVRRLEMDMETISLNRKVVGFGTWARHVWLAVLSALSNAADRQ